MPSIATPPAAPDAPVAAATQLLALHGIVQRIPAGWDVVGTYGDWLEGQAVLADNRQPSLSISWRRGRRPGDLRRCLAGVGAHMRREQRSPGLASSQALGGDGLLGRWSGQHGDAHAAVRGFAEAGATVFWRQLAPGSAASLAAVAASAEVAADHQPARWRLHGLALDLPPWWRLEGIQHLAGLVRAVWCRYAEGRRAADQVLVMRRLACAGRVLAGRGLEAWMRANLRPGERVLDADERPDALRLVCRERSRNWWRRLRGREDERHLHAWIDADADRLTVQEWKGRGEPLACLRSSADGSPG